jgi:hypothetical protein
MLTKWSYPIPDLDLKFKFVAFVKLGVVSVVISAAIATSFELQLKIAEELDERTFLPPDGPKLDWDWPYVLAGKLALVVQDGATVPPKLEVVVAPGPAWAGIARESNPRKKPILAVICRVFILFDLLLQKFGQK